jgi:hypothetical protein
LSIYGTRTVETEKAVLWWVPCATHGRHYVLDLVDLPEGRLPSRIVVRMLRSGERGALLTVPFTLNSDTYEPCLDGLSGEDF